MISSSVPPPNHTLTASVKCRDFFDSSKTMWILCKETDSACISFKVCDISTITQIQHWWTLSTRKAMKLESTCFPFQVQCTTLCFLNHSLLFTHHKSVYLANEGHHMVVSKFGAHQYSQWISKRMPYKHYVNCSTLEALLVCLLHFVGMLAV